MPSISINTVAAALGLVASVSLAAGCSSENGTADSNGAVNGEQQDSGGGSSDAATGDSSGNPLQIPDGGGGDSSISPDAACAASHVDAENPIIDLYIMADRSSSMNDGGWATQRKALKAFFVSSAAKGVFVALNFFPCPTCSEPADADHCQGDEYNNPQLHGVDWGELPAHTAKLLSFYDSVHPGGFTPTEDALTGALRGALDRQMEYPEHVVAVILVSDGEPTDCKKQTGSGLGRIAERYATSSPSIHTFTIYTKSGASDVMDGIAEGGGTKSAFDATAGAQQFVGALQSVLHTMRCVFKMPTADSGELDPNLVQVSVTYTGKQPEHLKRVVPPATCGPDGGWHYDNEDTPKKLILCPTTCEQVQKDDAVKVDILVGCKETQR